MKLTTAVKKAYTITLNEEEAETLMAVFSHIGGDPEKSRRKYTEEIFKALKNTGLHYDDGDIGEGSAIMFHKI